MKTMLRIYPIDPKMPTFIVVLLVGNHTVLVPL